MHFQVLNDYNEIFLTSAYYECNFAYMFNLLNYNETWFQLKDI